MALIVTDLVPPTVKTTCVTSLQEPVLNVNMDGLGFCAIKVLHFFFQFISSLYFFFDLRYDKVSCDV